MYYEWVETFAKRLHGRARRLVAMRRALFVRGAAIADPKHDRRPGDGVPRSR